MVLVSIHFFTNDFKLLLESAKHQKQITEARIKEIKHSDEIRYKAEVHTLQAEIGNFKPILG